MNTLANNQVKKPYTGADFFWILIVALIVILIFVFIFQFAWNGSITHIFGLKPISYVQALLLLIVAKMIFPSCPTMGLY